MRSRFLSFVLFEGCIFECFDVYGCAMWSTTCEQRCFGKPIAWIEGFTAQTTGGKGVVKLLKRLSTYRLRSVGCDFQTAQVERFALLWRGFSHTQVIGKVRRTRHGGFEA